MDTEYIWEGHPVKFCPVCEAFCVICEDCKNGTCNGGGCDKCHDFFDRWIENYKEITKDWLITPEMRFYAENYDPFTMM